MRWLSDTLRTVCLGGNWKHRLLFPSYRVFIPHVMHEQNAQLTDLHPQTCRPVTHSSSIHCFCTKISLGDAQYYIVYNTKGLETTSYLMSGKKVKVSQPCPTLCNPRDYTAHGILQARTLEWVAFPFSRGSSQPRGWTQVSRIAGGFFASWDTREALMSGVWLNELIQYMGYYTVIKTIL